VFQCDNDVVDQQVVNIEFESGATASFVMSAFNKGGRRIRIMGTKGEMEGYMDRDYVTVFDFSTRTEEKISIGDFVGDESIVGGHGGGDGGIICAFCQIISGTYTGESYADITTSVSNHLITFAAEESRLTDKVILLDEYKKRFY
jgi:predicted dehydrogenase